MTSTPTRPPLRRWWLLLAALLAGLVVLLLVIGLWLLPRVLLSQVQRQAADHGVMLEGCDLDYAFDGWRLRSITLRRCQLSVQTPLAGKGAVHTIEITLENWAPRRLAVRQPQLEVWGTLDVEDFEQQSVELASGLSVSVSEGFVRWAASEAQPELLVLRDVNYESQTQSGSAALELAQFASGSIQFGKKTELTLALNDHPKTQLRAVLDPEQSLGTVRGEFADLELRHLALLFSSGLPAALRDVRVDGKLFFELPLALNPQPPRGEFDFDLHGLNFPVPRELQGLVYGGPARLSGRFTSDRVYEKFTLDPISFRTGSLTMRGSGRALREQLNVGLQARMSGQLSCQSIVKSAATVHLNTPLAKAAATIARRALSGSVTLYAFVEANSADLSRAQVIETIGNGCGLVRLPLTETLALSRELLQDIPELQELLAPLQKAMPPAGKLPKLELPKWELPKLPNLLKTPPTARDGVDGE